MLKNDNDRPLILVSNLPVLDYELFFFFIITNAKIKRQTLKIMSDVSVITGGKRSGFGLVSFGSTRN